MAFNTYTEGLKRATDLANKAVTTESSLSTLSPLVSPLSTLQKAFPLYISAADAYSRLLASSLVVEAERAVIKKKWRLVLERAEKVKARIEEIGGHVGKAASSDEGEEEAVKRRGGVMNAIHMDFWTGSPPERDFRDGGQPYQGAVQPELAKEQDELEPEWTELPKSMWDVKMKKEERWVAKQGPGADCSVVAGIAVCLEHNRRWGTTLAQDSLWPQAVAGRPRHSENGEHIVKLLFNGVWRGVLIDALLPRSKTTHAPLYSISQPLEFIPSDASHAPSSNDIGPPWIALALKGYFKANGGYSIRGSNPAPDIYTFTGWIPERLSLLEGFQREKEWKRIKTCWEAGKCLITLGTAGGRKCPTSLIPLHAYAVLSLHEDENERLLEVYDPGLPRDRPADTTIEQDMQNLKLSSKSLSGHPGVMMMTWDEVSSNFENLSLNWSPSLFSNFAIRHWFWPKPSTASDTARHDLNSLRYRLAISSSTLTSPTEVWILLSQHITNKDRPLDDITLHVSEDHDSDHKSRSLQSHVMTRTRPYSNAVHVLARHTVRRPNTTLNILPIRDRGVYRTDFTLQVFATENLSLNLERIVNSLPFSLSLQGSLTTRNGGGHAGLPSWMDNPQYKVVLSQNPDTRGNAKGKLQLAIRGDKNLAWNVKLLWGSGELVYEWSEEVAVLDSGAYSYGLAYANIPAINPGTYTLVISTFEPRQTGTHNLSFESTLPIAVSPLAAEGAGMYSRMTTGVWTKENACGRPSTGLYDRNCKIEVMVPKPCNLFARGLLPTTPTSPIPINLTLFHRSSGTQLGSQISTSGPYSDTISGVVVPKLKLDPGVYVFVISAWEVGLGVGENWQVRVWSDGPLEVEVVKD